MSLRLSNEEIREKLLKLNYKCGPVTDTTREIHLKKLNAINNQLFTGKKFSVRMTDEELRSKLREYGETVAPITSANRHIYMKRLENLSVKNSEADSLKRQEDKFLNDDDNECEPMEID